ncbi:GNAT family N-acetyltransferase [Chitinophaga sp. Cy-1792]|uniref:GNAT family N-acetyltransferase n=1 Tax=Chitinophaga sp. Cy-1792 TaxID=2608339 RepID=UPI00141DEA96|nr:GNAT family N-acetyltransferase [Chitinophaga sp. Cy-1792]NIG54124.1 GNAT family N-acetyltransferase [Chitinophaga sp. Cy-1792]
MNIPLTTTRLSLAALTVGDAAFILELVNTEGWKKFIGERHVYNLEDAIGYITKITGNPDIQYKVVRTIENSMPVGIITYIKRTYLPHPDIGFAFLPMGTGQGYAFEAASAFLDLLKAQSVPVVYATTFPDNIRSMQLLGKLGFSFSTVLHREDATVNLFELQLG